MNDVEQAVLSFLQQSSDWQVVRRIQDAVITATPQGTRHTVWKAIRSLEAQGKIETACVYKDGPWETLHDLFEKTGSYWRIKN